MDIGCRGGFISTSRTELVEHYALDAFEEVFTDTLEGWEALDDNQRWVVFQAVTFGARVACAALGETGTYEQEYQRMLGKLATQ
jgi:uncharacterized protein with von Willebrand factor type A (vWA) domain